MSFFAQLTLNGLIAGSIYALIAVGFSLIYSTNKIMHFAHGIAIALSAYILFESLSVLKVGLFNAIIFTLILAVLFGLFTYNVIYLPLRKKKASNVILIIASLALLVLFENVIQLVFGSDVKTVKYFESWSSVNIFGAIVTPVQIIIVIAAICLLVALYFIMKKTTIGRNMRAVADNRELASISGINERRVANYSFVIGSVLAGIAGILLGLEQTILPSMGTGLVIKGFTGAIIGGIGSVPASILGSYILGFAENYGIMFLPSGYKEAIAFVLLFIFLLFKPTGLFGKNKGARC
ncbi:Branched-chain amino acid transport system / permease component [uncultured archaeon]|nr:Branched-chain amino acid transport system / permease component [uncultured archaeon]